MYIVWNVQEAENVGILASLKISHFPFWFPTLKGSIREREGNGKNPFPKFGNGKGMKKNHSRNSGTGRDWKNPFPKLENGNQRPPFLRMTGNGNSRSPLAEAETPRLILSAVETPHPIVNPIQSYACFEQSVKLNARVSPQKVKSNLVCPNNNCHVWLFSDKWDFNSTGSWFGVVSAR